MCIRPNAKVRFKSEGEVRRFVLTAIMETLTAVKSGPLLTGAEHAPENKSSSPDPGVNFSAEAVAQVRPAPHERSDALTHTTPMRTEDGAALPANISPQKKSHSPAPATETPDRSTPAIAKQTINAAEATDPTIAHSKTSKQPAPPHQSTPQWRLITLLKKRYALFETERGLLVLHIRHADQRVRFERICKEAQKTTIAGQNLLIPHPVELEPLASETLKSQLTQINTQGFHIEEFGRNIYRIESVPVWLSSDQAEEFIRDYIDLIRLRSGVRKQGNLGMEALARLAVKDSYRRKDLLNETAVRQLAQELFACDTPHTSPFGKPTFNEISWSEWQRRFDGE